FSTRPEGAPPCPGREDGERLRSARRRRRARRARSLRVPPERRYFLPQTGPRALSGPPESRPRQRRQRAPRPVRRPERRHPDQPRAAVRQRRFAAWISYARRWIHPRQRVGEVTERNMLDAVIRWSLRYRTLVLVLALVALGYGGYLSTTM